jgi:hypothetical protein
MRALLTLGLIGAIGYATNGTAEPETAFTPSAQIEVHSVVVDEPQARALPQGSGEIWDLLESSGQLVETRDTAILPSSSSTSNSGMARPINPRLLPAYGSGMV